MPTWWPSTSTPTRARTSSGSGPGVSGCPGDASAGQATGDVRRPDRLHELRDRVLVGREGAGTEVRARQAALHRLARRPVLLVRQVPELDGSFGLRRRAGGHEPGALDP